MSGTGILGCNRCGAHGMSLTALLEHQRRWHGRVPLDVAKALAAPQEVA